MKKYCTEIILAIILLALSLISIFVGVIDIDIKDLLTNDNNALMIFVVSRLPRLLAIICTGMGMSVAGLIMQQLCMNKFVSPTTGATISSAQLGILLALLFIPNSTLWQRAGFAFVTAILGTWVFVWFIQKVQYKDVVMVPLVGIMFGNVIGGITNFLASLIGPNGAGKSTVMSIISRLIAPDNGSVVIEKKDINKWNSKELSKHLAILTQTNNIQMKLTVEELVAFGRFPHSGGRLNSKDKEMIDKAIDYMELETFRERFIDELSGGQRQRAYIAMVIAQDTEYVLLDEPTNNLDIYHASNLMKIVRRLCDELGKTVILVLHEINYAAFYSDYICAFKDGKIASFGTVEEVITKENLSSIYNVEFEIMQIKGKPLSIYY